jgi:hypothetical protein
MLRLLSQLLDNSTLDAIYLALERKAVLLSEDGALRLVAAEVGVADTLGVQPLLMNLRDERMLNQTNYSRIVIHKLAHGHDFISVASEDLFWAAKESPAKVSPLVKTALESFKRPTLELRSGVLVCADFLRLAAESLLPKIVKQYYTECLHALRHGRGPIASRIADVLRTGMENVLATLKQPRRSALRQELRKLFKPDEPPKAIRLKELSRAIRKAFGS